MIYGLVGYKGSGKTTACNIIKKHLTDVVQINFKDALVAELKDNFPDLLREIADQHYGEPPVDWLFNNKPPLVRTLMQNYGTDVRRKEDSNYWVKKWMTSVGCKNPANHIIVDDVRFFNESYAIRKWNDTILIRLERTDIVTTDQHQSETEQQQIECDYTISVGQGELDKLEEELIKILNVHNT